MTTCTHGVDAGICTRCHPHLLHSTGCNCSPCRGDSEIQARLRRLELVHGDLAPSEDEIRDQRGEQ